MTGHKIRIQWLRSLLAMLAVVLAAWTTPLYADQGTLQLDPAGGGYAMRLGPASRVASGDSGTVFQIPIDEPPGSSRDAPAVAKLLRVVPAFPDEAVRVDVVTRRDGVRVVQLVLSGEATAAQEVLLALYWHDGSFRRLYEIASIEGAPDEVRPPVIAGAAAAATAATSAAPGSPVTTESAPPVADGAQEQAQAPVVPPVLAPAPAAAITTTTVETPTSTVSEPLAEPRVEDTSIGSRLGNETGAATRVTANSGDEIFVRRGDSLWLIAERAPIDGFSQHQVMMALYESNRDAFGGNVDTLLEGTRLRVPDASVLSRYSTDEAVQAFVENSRFVPQASETASPPPIGLAGGELRGDTPAGNRDQLEVGVDANDPASATERDTAFSMAMAEAESRIADLTEQVEQLETLIQLKDIQISEAQEKLAEASGGRTFSASDGANGATIGLTQSQFQANDGVGGSPETNSRDSADQAAGVSAPGAVATVGAGLAGAGSAAGNAVGAGADAAVAAARDAASQVNAEVENGSQILAIEATPVASEQESPLLGGFSLPDGFWTFAAGIVIALIIVLIVLRLRKRRHDDDDDDYDDEDDYLFDESTQPGAHGEDDTLGEDTLGDLTGSREPNSPRTTTA